MRRVTRREARPWLGALLVVLAAGAVIAIVLTRSPGQPQVSAGVLPVALSAQEADVYVDCSQNNGITYDPHNPCQTFLLLKSNSVNSARVLLAAEAQRLTRAGWHHTAQQVVDYDGESLSFAAVGQSWVAPNRQACAYVATGEQGVRAETRELFPYDPYNQPAGVLDFYRKAQAATAQAPTVWIRLRPPFDNGRCVA